MRESEQRQQEEAEREFNSLYMDMKQIENGIDSSGEIAQKAYRKLASTRTTTPEQEDGSTSQHTNSREGERSGTITYLHELISAYVAEKDEEEEGDGNTKADWLLKLPFALWREEYTAAALTLMLYRQVLKQSARAEEGQRERSKKKIKRMGPMLGVSERLLWLDAKRGTRRFRSLHESWTQMAMDPSSARRMPREKLRAMMSLSLRWFHVYNSADEGGSSTAAGAEGKAQWAPGRQKERWEELERGLVEGGASYDFVVSELSWQLQNVSDFDVLVSFVSSLRLLRHSALLHRSSLASLLQFQRSLHHLTLPGWPRFPPRLVREEVVLTLDSLFPRGRRLRRIVHLSFRIFRPGHLPNSLRNFFGNHTLFVSLRSSLSGLVSLLNPFRCPQ